MKNDSGCIGVAMMAIRLVLSLSSVAWNLLVLTWVVSHPAKLAVIWDWMWN